VARVKFSTGLPNCREGRQNRIGTVTLDGMLRLATVADELGYWSLWPNEFFITPPDVLARYSDAPVLYDTIVTMCYVAAATKHIRITPSTIVLPLHEPLLLARQIATLDVFSGGRITLGVGLGGSADEFRRMHGTAGNPNRGKMMDEYIPALRTLWTQRKATFSGEQVSFSDLEMYPKPAQDPLPIFMAGTADAVYRRVGQHAQGWIETVLLPEDIRSSAERIRGYAQAAGRDSAQLEIARQFYVSIAPTEEEARAIHADAVPPATAEGPATPAGAARTGQPASPQERSLIGTPEQIRDRLEAYVEAGVTELCMIFYHADAASAERQLRLFAEKVMPAFG
jgi:probable F420-dependent oxidoreductase